MKDKRNLFFEQVNLLTRSKVDIANINVSIPSKYHPLFNNERKDSKFTLNEIAHRVNEILLRKEEYGDANLDKRGRYDRNKSCLVQNGMDQSPVVDELILYIVKQFGFNIKNIWPGGKKAAVCLTHDVDSISGLSHLWLRKANWYSRWLYHKVKKNRRDASKWLSTISKWRQFKHMKIDPEDSFDKLVELESKYGVRSTFYFMSLRHELGREGRKYSIQNPRLVHITRELLKGGWEVGLHAAYYNHLSLTSLKKQRQRLEEVIQEKVKGCRHHYLRIRLPQSWMLYSLAGFSYSSNIGWSAGSNGFRAGTCLPYQPLKGEHSLWEIPFQLMDTNPILNQENYLKTFSKYLSCTKEVGGCLVINFHQEHFNEEVAPGVVEVYRNILEIITKDKDITVLTMDQVRNIVDSLTRLP
jgi:peptidoglycan/xylan/chitin deacetylase (PgdA/CDA1 family)